MIKVDLDFDHNRIKTVLDDRRAKFAIMAATNRALNSARTEGKRALRERYTVKAGAIDSASKINKAGFDDLTGDVTYKDAMTNVSKYKVTKTKRKPIAVTILKSSGPKQFKGSFWRGNEVWRRKGRKRLPIKRVYGPAVAQLVGAKQVQERMGKKAQETYNKRLEHEVKGRMGGEWGRS